MHNALCVEEVGIAMLAIMVYPIVLHVGGVESMDKRLIQIHGRKNAYLATGLGINRLIARNAMAQENIKRIVIIAMGKVLLLKRNSKSK